MNERNFPGGIYLIDFEFHPVRNREGNVPLPVCMVVWQWPSGTTFRYCTMICGR
jgi:hypothetical protein